MSDINLLDRDDEFFIKFNKDYTKEENNRVIDEIGNEIVDVLKKRNLTLAQTRYLFKKILLDIEYKNTITF